MSRQNDLLTKALASWDTESQLDMVIEECAELIDAIQKYRRGRVKIDALIEEGVDVELCVAQLKLIANPDGLLWELWQTKKLERLERLLKLTDEKPSL